MINRNCHIALAGLLHDIGIFATRAKLSTQKKERETVPKSTDQVIYRNSKIALDQIVSYFPSPSRDFASGHSGYGTVSFDSKQALQSFILSQFDSKTLLHWITVTAARVAHGFNLKSAEFENSFIANTERRNLDQSPAHLHCLLENINPTEDHVNQGVKLQRNYCYPLKPFCPASLFPEKIKLNQEDKYHQEYKKIWNDFLESFQKISKFHKNCFSLWIEDFNTLWMTFTHSVPSSSELGVVADTSMYDHSRVTSALSVALWNYHEFRKHDSEWVVNRLSSASDGDEKKFLFIEGDLSGIQDFIFTSGGKTNKFAAKLLRGRSFYVSLLAECAALQILDTLQLPPTCQVLNAAGKFTIIAPNNEDVVPKLLKIKQDFDEWFLKYTFGQTSVSIAWTEASCSDLESKRNGSNPFRQFMSNLFAELENTKLKRFDLCNQRSSDCVIDQAYLKGVKEHNICEIDGKAPGDGGIRHDVRGSKLAFDQLMVGEHIANNLPEENQIFITREKLTNQKLEYLKLKLFGYAVAFGKKGIDPKELQADVCNDRVLRIWDFSLPNDSKSPLFNGIARKNVNSWVPRANHNVLDFEHIASKSEGVNALITVKGDIDNLGRIFQQGLKNSSLAKTTFLSRQIDAFFTVYFPILCQNHYKTTYTVFAGGDDFMLIGPWSDQIELSTRMRKDFNCFVANNSAISFSCGLAMTKSSIPVRHLALISENYLEEAKSFPPKKLEKVQRKMQ